MRLCYFDDVMTGHHPSFLNGLAAATLRTGVGVIAAAPFQPATAGVEWLEVPSSNRSQAWQGRRTLRKVSRDCQQGGVDIFVDLNLDKNIWNLPRSIGRFPWRTHVLHHAHQYLFEGRTSAGRWRTRYLRRTLRSLAARGDLFVTHTSRAAEILTEIVSSDSILQLGYPVRSGTEITEHPADPQPPIPVVLFVGQARHEKGLPDLLTAVEQVSDQVTVHVVGPQKPAIRQELEDRFRSLPIIWEDRYVETSELASLYRSASLIATPYRSTFGRDGGASGVLLETLAYGKPLLATSAVSEQLPKDYDGAVVVPSEDPDALADGLRSAVGSLPRLSAAAATQGPVFIRNNHSFDNYVATLLERTSHHER